jgi:hypothetical protein
VRARSEPTQVELETNQQILEKDGSDWQWQTLDYYGTQQLRQYKQLYNNKLEGLSLTSLLA